MNEQFIRTESLLGKDSTQKFASTSLAIFGIGGVGGYVAEMSARMGIGKITLVDKDIISESNLNRQIIALHSTIGKNKVDVMKERILDISPTCVVNAIKLFYLPESASQIDLSNFDIVIDAMDNITAKLFLIRSCKEKKIKIISCMGTANKFDPMAFKSCDISKTDTCHLARIMRKELKKDVEVIYSTELAKKNKENPESLGSLPFVPPAAGLLLSKSLCNFIINR